MATYAISFNLHYDSTYSDRYDSLMKAIRSSATVWEETTSFALVESSKSLTIFEIDLYLSKFDATKDILVVIDVTNCAAEARGKIADKTKLRKLLPNITIN